jgi:acetyl esterase/lipase
MLTRRAFVQGVGAAMGAAAVAPWLADAVRTPAALAQTAGYDPAQRYPVQVSDVEYRRDGDKVYLATVYQPQGAGPFPAMVDIHGGQWRTGDRTGSGPISEVLAASGLVVFAPDFRNSPDGPYPASVADVNYATRWFKAHADDFHASPRYLGGMGSSSGGHLVMLSAMRPDDPRYAARPLAEAPEIDATLDYLVLVWPILDPYGRFIFAQETGRADIVASTRAYFAPWDTIWEGSPMAILERGETVEMPATLIVQGTSDANVTPALQERFAAAYRAAGGNAELEIFENQPHGFATRPGPETDRALALMKAFIARQLAVLSARQ